MDTKRKCGSLALALLVSGCASLSVSDLEPPRVEEFPNREVAYRVAGTQDSVRDQLVQLLSKRTLFHRVEIRAPQTHVVTAYISEPDTHGARRVRKTAYRFSVGPTSPPTACAPLSVTWLVKSRGIREELWSIQEADVSHVPASWNEIKTLFENQRCPQ